MSEPLADDKPPVKELTRAQRRVLGVLLEKGFTTPEVYPLTLKAVVSGCNQKSNRDPVVNYDEDQAEQVLDELRALGLAAIVHTESGRSARFRHYMRHRFTLTEPQLAILTELMLRGQQSLGELRTRASRMVPIDSLEQLRAELAGLIELEMVQSDGPLDRRGAEVDHKLYPPQERQTMRPPAASSRDEDRERGADARCVATGGGSAALEQRLAALEQGQEQLRAAQESVHDAIDALKSELEQLANDFADLRRALGS